MKILIGLFLMLMFAMFQDARACNSEKQSKDVEYLASIPDFPLESVQLFVNLDLKTHVCLQPIDYGLYRYSHNNAYTNSSRLLKSYSEIGYIMAE
jgi:hypothetical protein